MSNNFQISYKPADPKNNVPAYCMGVWQGTPYKLPAFISVPVAANVDGSIQIPYLEFNEPSAAGGPPAVTREFIAMTPPPGINTIGSYIAGCFSGKLQTGFAVYTNGWVAFGNAAVALDGSGNTPAFIAIWQKYMTWLSTNMPGKAPDDEDAWADLLGGTSGTAAGGSDCSPSVGTFTYDVPGYGDAGAQSYGYGNNEWCDGLQQQWFTGPGDGQIFTIIWGNGGLGG